MSNITILLLIFKLLPYWLIYVFHQSLLLVSDLLFGITAKLLHINHKTVNMKRFNYLGICLLVMIMTLSSCEVIGDIFQAGMAVGIIVVIAVVALIIWLVTRFRR